MKREDLTKLGLTDEAVIDKIMALHGSDIESHKAKLATANTELDSLKAQLSEASTTIEGFKKLDIDGVKKSADEWKAKAEAAQAEAAKQMADLKFGHALDQALAGAKARNPKAVKALLNADLLKLADDGTISGLNDQLTKIKAENDYLFESDQKPPQIVTGGNNQSVISDPFMTAMRKGAGLSLEGK